MLCIDCAGYSATWTGITYDGHRCDPVTVDDVIDWAPYVDDLGPLVCEGNHLQAEAHAGHLTIRQVDPR